MGRGSGGGVVEGANSGVDAEDTQDAEDAEDAEDAKDAKDAESRGLCGKLPIWGGDSVTAPSALQA